MPCYAAATALNMVSFCTCVQLYVAINQYCPFPDFYLFKYVFGKRYLPACLHMHWWICTIFLFDILASRLHWSRSGLRCKHSPVTRLLTFSIACFCGGVNMLSHPPAKFERRVVPPCLDDPPCANLLVAPVRDHGRRGGWAVHASLA